MLVQVECHNNICILFKGGYRISVTILNIHSSDWILSQIVGFIIQCLKHVSHLPSMAQQCVIIQIIECYTAHSLQTLAHIVITFMVIPIWVSLASLGLQSQGGFVPWALAVSALNTVVFQQDFTFAVVLYIL